MWPHLENKTITIGFTDEQFQSNDDFLVHILEADNVTIPVVLRLQKQVQWLICVIGWLMVLIGSYFRYILYTYLFEQYKIKEVTPINVLIVVASVIQHVNVAFFMLWCSFIFFNDILLEYWNTYCVPTKLLFQFDMIYSYVAGLGISIYRILYIKHDYWVKYTIGEKTCS